MDFVSKCPQSLIDLFGATFTITTADMHELVEFIDMCGDVDEGITEFVDDTFRSDMLACHDAGITFDVYTSWITFPYEEDAFRVHLRKIWDECIGE